MWNGPDLRLAYLLLLNAAVLLAAFRATRRWTGDLVQRAVDALLLWYAVQYAAICIPGLAHLLSLGSMSLVALAAAGALAWFSRGAPVDRKPLATAEACVLLGALAFALGFIVDICWKQFALPVLDSDAMTYHVPAALDWLRSGRLRVFPVWFFNPANAFSPLAGSTFIAWLLAPMAGDDTVARVVQAPALVLLFFAVVRLARGTGASVTLGALAGLAAVVSRPFISEVIAARDDVFLAAFIAVAIAACAPEPARDRFGPWRIGLAIGLAAATKYTFLFAAPLLLLAIDAPAKAGWRPRHWAAALATIALVAGPWYLRNLLMTGNPLYPVEVTLFGHPVLPGLVQPLRTARLATGAGANAVLLNAFHGPTHWLTAALLLGWASAAAIGRGAWRNPLLRAAVLGFPICLLLFIARAPYGEIRFLFPAILLLFAATTAALTRWIPSEPARIAVVSALALLCLRSSFEATDALVDVTTRALVVAAVAVACALLDARAAPEARARLRTYGGLVAALAFALVTYVYWGAFVQGYHEVGGGPKAARLEDLDPDLRTEIPWLKAYPHLGPAWRFARDDIPPGATIAYANTYLVYPLYGQPPTKHAIYVPVRADVTDFWHLPRFPEPLPGEEIVATFARLLNEHPDHDAWLRRLLASNADYLFIGPGERDNPPPPELTFATADAAHFTKVFADGNSTIFRITR